MKVIFHENTLFFVERLSFLSLSFQASPERQRRRLQAAVLGQSVDMSAPMRAGHSRDISPRHRGPSKHAPDLQRRSQGRQSEQPLHEGGAGKPDWKPDHKCCVRPTQVKVFKRQEMRNRKVM